MKNCLTLACILAFGLASPLIQAQTPQKSTWTITWQQGLQASNFQEDLAEGSQFLSYQRGYTGGLSVQYRFRKRWSLQSELLYSQKGWRYTFFELVPCLACENNIQFLPNSSVKVKQSNDYLDIPFLLRYDFGNRFRFFINAGAYFSILLNQSTRVQEVDIGFESLSEPSFRSWDWGLSTGLGMDYSFSQTWGISLNANYQYGLGNINQNEIPYPIEFPEQQNLQNQSFALRAGLSYTFGQE